MNNIPKTPNQTVTHRSQSARQVTRNTIVFFGTEAWATPILETVSQYFLVATVVTRPSAKGGRKHQLVEPPIRQAADKLQIPTLQPVKISEIEADLSDLRPDIGVVVAYGKLIPDKIIKLFKYGILNVHPSLLPKYRGPSPIESTILNNDQPGFTIIQLSDEMDAGDILSSKPINVSNLANVTAPDLYVQAGQESAAVLVDCIQNVLSKTAIRTPQNNPAATFTNLIQKSDGLIDWTNPAHYLERQIRAYAGWPGSRTTIASTDIIITKGHVIETPIFPEQSRRTLSPGTAFKTEVAELAVVCGDHQALVIDFLKPAGKNEMTGQAFLSGHALD